MPRTQTTSVEIVMRARATAARTELRGLRKDVAEFGTFTRDTFRNLGGGTIKAPKLGSEWNKLRSDVVGITTDVRKAVQSLNDLKARAPSLTLRGGGVRINGGGAGGGAVAGGGVSSRREEIEEASRLTREYNAGTLALDGYIAKLREVAAASVEGSEKQLDALNRLRRASDAAARQPVFGARQASRTEEIAGAARLTREYEAGTLSLAAYRSELQKVTQTGVAGSEAQIDALQRLNRLHQQQRSTAQQTRAGRIDRIQAGANVAQTVGDAATAGTLAGAAVFASAVRETVAYEGALRNVNSIAKLSEQQFQALYTKVLDIAKDPAVRQGPVELAKGLYEIESSGFHGQKGLDVLKAAAMGASAGLTDSATSSHALISILNSGITGVTSAQQAMDVLFKTVDVGTLSFAGLANNVGKVLPTAAKAGVSIQELGAAFAVMTNQGLSAESSATGLLNLISHIASPSKEAAKHFREQGVSFGFAGLQAKGLTGIIQELSAKTHGNADEIKKFLPEMRAQRALLSLTVNEGQRYLGFLDQMADAQAKQGSTKSALDEQNKSFRSQMELLRKEFQILAVEVGPAFIKTLRDLLTAARPTIDTVKRMAEAFSALPEKQQQTIIKMVAMVAAFGPFLSGGARLVSNLANVAEQIDKIRGAANASATALPAIAGGAEVATTKLSALSKVVAGLQAVPAIAITAIVSWQIGTAIGNWISDKMGDAGLKEDAQNYGNTVKSEAKNVLPYLRNLRAATASGKNGVFPASEQQTTARKDLDDMFAKDMSANKPQTAEAAQQLFLERLDQRIRMYEGRLNAPGPDKNKIWFERMRNQIRSGGASLKNSYQNAGDPSSQPKPSGGPVQPPPDGKDTGDRTPRVNRPIVSQVPAINLETTVADLTGRYGTAMQGFTERGSWLSNPQRQTAVSGLTALANRIQAAEEKTAREKLTEANLAAGQTRAEAKKLAAAAKNDNDRARVAELLKQADTNEAEAKARYNGQIKEIQRQHSDRYRTIYKENDRIEDELAKQRAANEQAAAETEAKQREERIAAIDDQLKHEQDAAKRAGLLAERYDEAEKAAAARLKGELAAASVVGDRRNPNDPERRRAVEAARQNYGFTLSGVGRERAGANADNTIQGMEEAARISRQEAEATQDLVQRHAKLTQVRTDEIAIMEKQGASEAALNAQRRANTRESSREEADIARSHAEALLVQASVNGVGSFVSPTFGGTQRARDDAGAAALARQLQTYFNEQYDKTEQLDRGKVVEDQLSLLSRAVQEGMVTLQQVLPLMSDLEKRVTATGDLDATTGFYKSVGDMFSKQLADTFKEYDRKRGPERDAKYDALIAGIKSGTQFTGLTEREKEVVVRIVSSRQANRDDSDKTKYHSGLTKIIDETASEITRQADQHSGEFLGALFGRRNKAKEAAREFWQQVSETGQRSIARIGNELLLKPIGRKITGSIQHEFERGAEKVGQSLTQSLGSFRQVFKEGASSILQAAVYLNGILALAGKQGGRRGKKGGMLGAAVGVGVGLLTGGTGLALVGAGLTGASAGSKVAQGDYFGAALSVGSAYLPGGVLTGGGGPAVGSAGKTGLARGGAAGGGFLYEVNEERRWHGPEYFSPNMDGLVIPSATAISRLPTVAAANNELLGQLTALLQSGGGMGGGSQQFVMNDYGDKYTEVDGERTLRKFSKSVRDGMNRRS